MHVYYSSMKCKLFLAVSVVLLFLVMNMRMYCRPFKLPSLTKQIVRRTENAPRTEHERRIVHVLGIDRLVAWKHAEEHCKCSPSESKNVDC